MRATRLRKVLTTDRSVGAVASHGSVMGMAEKKE